MGVGTSIEWCDVSWPIVNGCRRVSPGCQHCYSERLTATRLSKTPKYAGLATMTPGGPRYTGKTRLWEPDLSLPLRLSKPARIFCANMGDLFYEEVSDDTIALIFGVMALACHHTFQVLTKRPARMRELLSRLTLDDCLEAAMHRGVVLDQRTSRRIRDALPEGSPFASDSEAPLWPLPNVWCGVSAENQETADERIPELLATPAAVRFVSAEPLLGPLALLAYLPHRPAGPRHRLPTWGVAGLDWVIVGGESGPGARPCEVAAARCIVKQCQREHVAVFVKQLGRYPVVERVRASFLSWPEGTRFGNPLALDRPDLNGSIALVRDKFGGDMTEWPDDLRVRQFPDERAS